MKNYRLPSGFTEHFTSLEALRKSQGMKPVKKKTSNKDRLIKQQESFSNRHKCKACGASMVYIGGNMMACKNPNCKGIEIQREDKEGNTITSYITSYELLSEKGAEIANNIFN